mgnify:CR=1 FL=1
MKTCSHLTALAFSIERLIHTKKSDKKVFKLFKKMKLRAFSIFSLILSAFLSANKLFEYDSSTGSFNFLDDLNLKSFKFSYDYPFFNLLYRTLQGERWFREITFLHFVINDLLLYLFLIIVDIFLVVHIKRDLHQKKVSLKATMKRKDKRTQKKLAYLSHVSNETNQMIIYSLFSHARICSLSLHALCK